MLFLGFRISGFSGAWEVGVLRVQDLGSSELRVLDLGCMCCQLIGC